MNLETLRTLYQYDRWANGQVWACVEKLSDEQFTQESDYSIGSVHNQVFHLMGSELWSLKFFGEAIDDELKALKPEDFPTRPAIRSQWDGVPDNAFMILVLDEAAMRGATGVARYAEAFDEAM